jgi:hypothetical protein
VAKESKFHPDFVTDAEGRQTGVVLPIDEYYELIEDLADLAAAAERAGESTVSHEKVRAQLKRDGLLPS